ncbi:MAG TPA: M3 family metallopeptidase [Candidatus Babeliales bacterium]|jgi:thimet oligopeptidase|nr:M3 family metallopeptidase [Candidatus Babeliales bacterium]
MRIIYIILLFLSILAIGIFLYFMIQPSIVMPIKDHAHRIEDIIKLFSDTPDQIKKNTTHYIEQTRQALDNYVQLPAAQKNFQTSAMALDRLMVSDLMLYQNVLSALEFLSPDANIRETAHESSLEIQRFVVEYVTSNKPLYDAFIAYADTIAPTEQLTDTQRYFIEQTRKVFERSGLGLPEEQRARIATLHKDLAALVAEFDKNIAQDNRTITVDREGLAGLDDDFIASLRTTETGHYILGVDYPTVNRVLEQCAVEDTRKRLYEAFNNRAYPLNDALLRTIIQKRDELARILGFASYAAYDLDEQMVQTPERAFNFLHDIYTRAKAKEEKELERITYHLPESVTRTEDGLLKPWDLAYIKYIYKKNSFLLDEQLVSEYFPMEKTIEALFDIYQKFFSLSFKEVEASGLWHPEVKVLQVYKKNDQRLLGTLLLDLYPRDNKYSHAAHLTVIPSVHNVDGINIPDVSVVIANFTRSTPTKPSLLTRKDVSTFFHEFGHALHAILSTTDFATFSGTSVKRDFVEMPSQMLEEWLWDKDIVRSISSHYQTGQQLPEAILDTIVQLKQFDSGMTLRTQARYAILALEYFGPGADKDPYALLVDLYTKMAPEFYFDPKNHFYASFGHLTGYGAKYYGYLWSKVFALDLFAQIKKEGLLNPAIGKRYADIILARGGSKDPYLLLIEFLGREPRVDAFIKDLGL